MNPRHPAATATAPALHRPVHARYIDGLRAVAVLAVIVYHLQPGWLPGGFAGVDVFFVISGFVVAASVDDAGSMRLSRFALYFYARRVQRIAPALIVCLVATAIVSALFIPAAWLSDTNARTGTFAFFGLSNLILAHTGNDYFSPRVEFNPYMHTWSLGVEEQFYLLFPLLFCLWVGRTPRRRLSVGLFAAGLAASLLCAAWLGARNPTFAFYLIFGRFWELAAGVLLYQALSLAGRPLGRDDRPATFLSTLGLVASLALLGAGFAVLRPAWFPFPGALAPVAGTVGALYWLHGRAPRALAHRLMISRAAVFVGAISYSLYLWHWPVFVLLRWTTGLDSADERLVALATTFALAWASWIFVENPVRRSAMLKRMRREFVVGLGFGAVAAGALVAFGIDAEQPRLSLSVVEQHADDWYAYRPLTVAYGGCRESWDTRQLNGGLVWIYSRKGCALPPRHPGRVFVIGDSHAMAYNMMLRELALTTGVRVVAYNNGGCPFVGLLPRERQDAVRCKPYNDAAIATIIADARAGDVVFMPSLRLPRFSDEFARYDDALARMQMFGPAAIDSRRAGERDALPMLRALAAKGAHVVLEAPTPVFRSQPFRCADWFDRGNPICTSGDRISRAELDAFRAPVLASYARLVREVPSVSVWDPLPVLCPGAVCSAHAGGEPLFFDGDHLSAYANRLLFPGFERLIGRLMGGAAVSPAVGPTKGGGFATTAATPRTNAVHATTGIANGPVVGPARRPKA
ncbi:peptidoglycan/LPS O-acetylase OafA/YrhL [Paraburkholderia caballeronis]|uniref:acyltransferase family protein n=1 Tax=Paraburkholderia caballeronis TaxID=416943 RepID=UPI0010661E17|nr:acyltransferase family protein [Paraburkholderia caballeronis]TDV36243.1 peptidoglycan/LPS O-acetylase OafA/YrhL [Paraburkholderia caballeronis]